MLEIKNVHKYFNKGKKNELHVIHGTTLTLEDTGLVAFLGPSGCGKTTLLNAIGGLDSIKSGSIFINGKKISSKWSYQVDKIRNLNVGYIFQDYKLIDSLSVYDNVALVLKMIGIKDKSEIKKRVDYVLEKVGMLRYKRRPASMLSGGERQRVGIARAIVKDPNIILADEPTGNLDSKNSLEIMKIIKAISKDRLVLLVTHERPLAEFYASRIIEIRDGEVIKDYENKEVDSLDYAVDNRFYLKDFPVTQHIKEESCLIDLYKEEDSKIQLDVVVKNGNIYIKSNTKDKIEIVDENSSIEFIDEHYKKISKNDLDTYEFHFKDIIDSNFPKKYSSIFNPIRLIVNGFKKVFDFPILKKILLFGFAFSAMFIMYSISTLSASFRIKEEDFVKTNKNYLLVNTPKVTYDDYVKYSSFSSVSYLLLGDTTVSLKLAYQDFYQVNDVSGMISGSLTDASTLTSSDLILGRLPENDYEVVIDTLTIQNALKSNESLKMAWIRSEEDFLNRTLHVSHMKDFTIVGISDLKSPSIYVARSQFTNILANTSSDDSWTDESTTGMVDVALYQDQIVLKEGRMPNDYEAIVPISEKEVKPLNKVIQEEVNGKKLMVVGYYDSKEPYSFTLVNGATVTYSLFDRYTNFAVYPKDKEMALSDFQQENLNIKDSYQSDKDQYKENRKEQTKNAVFVSIVILSISLIEIYLMIRSSFLSRMKEVGILRAIGVKKMDIYKMFMGEIFAITMLASVPGLLFMAYVLSVLSSIPMMETMFVSSPFLVLFAFVFVLLFHLVVGLMPVFNTIRKTPASILSRHDLD